MNSSYAYLVALLLIEALLYALVKARKGLREGLVKRRVDVGFLTILVDVGTRRLSYVR
jgi:hypothetical protein